MEYNKILVMLRIFLPQPRFLAKEQGFYGMGWEFPVMFGNEVALIEKLAGVTSGGRV